MTTSDADKIREAQPESPCVHNGGDFCLTHPSCDFMTALVRGLLEERRGLYRQIRESIDKIRAYDLLEEILKENKVTAYREQDREPTMPPRAIEVGDGYWYTGDSLLSCLEQAVAAKEARDE